MRSGKKCPQIGKQRDDHAENQYHIRKNDRYLYLLHLLFLLSCTHLYHCQYNNYKNHYIGTRTRNSKIKILKSHIIQVQHYRRRTSGRSSMSNNVWFGKHLHRSVHTCNHHQNDHIFQQRDCNGKKLLDTACSIDCCRFI